MLLKLAKNGRHKDLPQNSWFYNIPEFEKLTDMQSTFVASLCDFESKIPKGLPEEERRKLAALEAGWKTRTDRHKTLETNGIAIVQGIPHVEVAIKKYRELQASTNEDYGMWEFLNERIKELKTFIAVPTADADEQKKKSALTKELMDLYERKKDFEKKIGKPSDPDIIGESLSDEADASPRKLSTIDQVHEENV